MLALGIIAVVLLTLIAWQLGRIRGTLIVMSYNQVRQIDRVERLVNEKVPT